MLDRNRCIKLSIFIHVFISTAIYFRDVYMYYLYFFSILFHDFLAVIYLFVFCFFVFFLLFFFLYLSFIDVNSNVAQHLSKKILHSL